jgi:hypothetical protein
LVPGDIVSIKLGDIIPADARLLEGDPLKIDQVPYHIEHVLEVVACTPLFEFVASFNNEIDCWKPKARET